MQAVVIEQIEHIAFRIAQKSYSFNEPIPDFSTRYPGILESCIKTPFQTFGGKELYFGFINKLAILFYLMIKNHPFENGNKRVAVLTMFFLLHEEGKWVKVDTQKLYNFAVWVASSPAEAKDEVVQYIVKFLKTHMILLSETE